MTQTPVQMSQSPSVATVSPRMYPPDSRLKEMFDRFDRHPACVYFLLFLWFLATSLIVYRRLIPEWFTADEVDILGNIDGRGMWQLLTGYDVSANNFVPLLLASLKLDWILFEWWLPGYRLHSMLAACFAAVMIVALCRRSCSWPTAILCGFVFLLSVDTAALIGYTASRHYLEGLIPALGAVLLTLRYIERGGALPLIGAVICYFIAALFKEIYAPLPAILLVMPGVSLRRRAMLLGVFAVPAAAYFFYRRAMMGQLVGGYGGGHYDPIYVASYFFRAWPRFSGWMIFGTARWAWWLVIPVNAVLAWTIYRAYRASWLHLSCLMTCLIVAVGPVALVLGTPQVRFIEEASHYCQRFTFPAFVVILLWSAWAMERLDRRVAAATLCVLLTIGVVNGRKQIRSWMHDGRVTHASARDFEAWWNRKVVYAVDIPRQLHLGLIKIWSRRAEAPPEHVARVIPAWPGAISMDDPILRDGDIVFMESTRSGLVELSRSDFLAKYAGP